MSNTKTNNGQKSGNFTEEPPKGPPQLSMRSVTESLKTLAPKMRGQSRRQVSNPQDHPWSCVALLNFFKDGNFQGHATGFYAGPDVVVTAAHNLMRTEPNAVGIYPSYDSNLNPTEVLAGWSWAWDEDRDVAVIISSISLPDTLQIANNIEDPITLAGYSETYPDLSPRMTYATSSGVVANQYLEYEMRVGFGDSGGPVFGTRSRYAFAIHVEARLNPSGQTLIGVGAYADDMLFATLDDLEQRARNYLQEGPWA